MREKTGTVVLVIFVVAGIIDKTTAVGVIATEQFSLQTDKEQAVVGILTQFTQFVTQQ